MPAAAKVTAILSAPSVVRHARGRDSDTLIFHSLQEIKLMRTRFAPLALLASLAASAAFAQSAPTWTPPDAATKTLALDIYRQLINTNTTDSVGSVTAASKAMQQRFLAAGWPASDVFLGGPNDRKENLVVRYRGTGKHEPILFIGHLDVVEARREDWTTDPF